MNKKAFTLIELLVVVLIIGILAAIAVPQYQKSVMKSRLSEAMLMVKNIKNQQEIFYLQNGRYAENCKELGVELPAGAEEQGNNFALNKGGYYVYYHCKDTNVVSVSIRDQINPADTSFLVAIQIFFNHDLPDNQKGNEGKMACYSYFTTGIGIELCKNLGKEKKSNRAYWL